MKSPDKLSALEQELNEDFQKGYLKYLKDYRIEDAVNLKKFSGIEPIIDEEKVQKGYAYLFDKNCGHSNIFALHCIERAIKIKELTGIAPSKEVAERFPDAYKRFLGEQK